MSKKILIIEDDKDSADLLAEALSIDAHVTVTANCFSSAVDSIRTHGPFNLILSDLQVPGAKNPETTIAELRSASGGTPLVLISGNADLPELAQTYGVPYLAKPISLDKLLELIHYAHD